MQANPVIEDLTPFVKGRTCAYRVLSPQRATLFLARAGKRWVIYECVGRGNSVVGFETLKTVAAWLASSQKLPAAEVLNAGTKRKTGR